MQTIQEQVAAADAWRAALREQIGEVAGVLNVTHARLVALTRQAIEAEGWQGWGIRSVEHWLTLQAGLSPTRAREIALLAEARADYPETAAAFEAGQLSVDQTVAVLRNAPPHNDAEAASIAKISSVSQIRAVLSKGTRFPGDDEDRTAEAAPASDERVPDPAVAPGRLAYGYQGSRFWLQLDTPADAGALVEQAIAEAHDALFDSGQPHVSGADALAEVARRSLSAAPGERAGHYRVLIHLDDGRAWLNGGPVLPAALRDRLTCVGRAAPLWCHDGVPVSVGRSQRIVPDRTRRLLADRDRRCLFPGCPATRHLEIHHLRHWADGGPTDTANLASLCPYHHDAHHRGEFTITGNPDSPGPLAFVDADGRTIPPLAKPRPPSPGEPLPRPNQPYRHPTGERIQTRWLHFSGPPPTPVLRA